MPGEMALMVHTIDKICGVGGLYGNSCALPVIKYLRVKT